MRARNAEVRELRPVVNRLQPYPIEVGRTSFRAVFLIACALVSAEGRTQERKPTLQERAAAIDTVRQDTAWTVPMISPPPKPGDRATLRDSSKANLLKSDSAKTKFLVDSLRSAGEAKAREMRAEIDREIAAERKMTPAQLRQARLARIFARCIEAANVQTAASDEVMAQLGHPISEIQAKARHANMISICKTIPSTFLPELREQTDK